MEVIKNARVCPICIEDLDDKQQQLVVMSKRCFHLFHKNCIEQWLDQGKRQCPVCKLPNLGMRQMVEPPVVPKRSSSADAKSRREELTQKEKMDLVFETLELQEKYSARELALMSKQRRHKIYMDFYSSFGLACSGLSQNNNKVFAANSHKNLIGTYEKKVEDIRSLVRKCNLNFSFTSSLLNFYEKLSSFNKRFIGERSHEEKGTIEDSKRRLEQINTELNEFLNRQVPEIKEAYQPMPAGYDEEAQAESVIQPSDNTMNSSLKRYYLAKIVAGMFFTSIAVYHRKSFYNFFSKDRNVQQLKN